MQQKVPSFFTSSMVEVLFYDKKTHVDFNDFSVFYYVVVLFNRFGDNANGIDTLLNEK